jgi:hypothetical protein
VRAKEIEPGVLRIDCNPDIASTAGLLLATGENCENFQIEFLWNKLPCRPCRTVHGTADAITADAPLYSGSRVIVV